MLQHKIEQHFAVTFQVVTTQPKSVLTEYHGQNKEKLAHILNKKWNISTLIWKS